MLAAVAINRWHNKTAMIEASKRRALFPTMLALAVLAFAVSVLGCCLLAIRGSQAQRCDQGCWVEPRESAVRNKQKLARLLLTNPSPVAETRTRNF
jgi:hypothetical protein